MTHMKPKAVTVHLGKRIVTRSEDDGLRQALTSCGWSESAGFAGAKLVWDIFPNDGEAAQYAELGSRQLISRFPGMNECCHKAVFAHLLGRMQKLLPEGSLDGRYIPRQWALPLQVAELSAHVDECAAAAKRRGRPKPVYIVKPDSGSSGDGIVLTGEPHRTTWSSSDSRVVQEYIAAPMLLEGLKFDLRLYVLLTSVGGAADGGPTRAFLYREGMARFAVNEYVPPSRANLRDVNMHLTNYSLNKKSAAYKHTDAPDGSDGSKRTASSVLAALCAAGQLHDVEETWQQIGELVGRALAVVQPALAAARGKWANPSFQVLGYDVLLDAQGRPWLVECNDHPSLRLDLQWDEPGQYSMHGSNTMPSPVDAAIKVPMLTDALRVVGELHGLPTAPPPPPADGGGVADRVGGAFGTNFFEVCEGEGPSLPGLDTLQALGRAFERHSPSDALRCATLAIDPALPGPRWKSMAFAKFVQTAGLVGGAGLSRADVDLIFITVCGKGGTMDVMDFFEACGRVASRLHPDLPVPEALAQLSRRLTVQEQ
eukprot:Transcript_22782.p1 GENE.Transcript_22782~~Transcript_22782.p1  ORF type:complete len:592 (-),score=193.38 Transcript_22782:52-1674(-)